MAQINSYTDRSAYTADATRTRTKSAVSFVTADNEQIFDGINIVADKNSAAVGDLVVFDKTLSKVRVIKAKTILKAQIPANLHPFGVVLGWRGDKVLFASLFNAGNARWAHPFEVRISGISTALSGTLAIIVQNNGSLSEEVDVSWNAGDTLTSIATSISAQFQTLTDADNRTWTASVDGSDIILSHNYSLVDTVTSITGTGGGSAVTYVEDGVNYQTTRAYLTTNEYVQRRNGVRSSFGGGNYRKFPQYYSTNGSTPTSAIPLGSTIIVNETAFEESEYCSALRDAYDTYEDYLFGEHMLQYPAASGAHLRIGKELTALLASLKGTDVRGEDENRYPAAAMALAYGISLDGYTTGFEAGNWWLPDVEEMGMMMRDRRYDASDTDTEDPVNDTLVKMGAATMYGSGFYPWISCECSSSSAFIFGGNGGTVSNTSKCYSYAVRPVSAF